MEKEYICMRDVRAVTKRECEACYNADECGTQAHTVDVIDCRRDFLITEEQFVEDLEKLKAKARGG